MRRFLSAIMMLAVAAGINAWAGYGAPHTLRGSSNMSTVNLSWKASTETQTLQWHNDDDYNGIDGLPTSNNDAAVLYIANRFDANDLKEYEDLSIDSLGFFQYRKVYSATLQIYENGKLVSETDYDVSKYKKNTMAVVKLVEPYKIKPGVELIIAAKLVAGRNVDFTGICDRAVNAPGKGNIYSYDGVNWKDNAPGDFLVTAYTGARGDKEADGYRIYRNDQAVNSELITDTEATLLDEPGGNNEYTVAAVYGELEMESFPCKINVVGTAEAVPGVNAFTNAVDGLNVSLTWLAPFNGEANPAYNTSDVIAGYLYGSASGLRTWAKVDYSADALAAYKNHTIKGVNVVLKDAESLTGLVYGFVMENGKIVSWHQLTADEKAAVVAGTWTKITLDTPVKINLGNSYSVGVFAAHAKGNGVIAVNDGAPVAGVSFVATSTSKEPFNTSSPYWSAQNKYNYLLRPEIVADGEMAGGEIKFENYKVYRDGELVATTTETAYNDSEVVPGTHEYYVKACFNNDRYNDSKVAQVKVEVPEEYAAPMFLSKVLGENNQLTITWGTGLTELKHYTGVKYSFGLTNEGNDVAIKYGAKFKADVLAPFVGKKIVGVNGVFGEGLKELSIAIYNGNTCLCSTKVDLATTPLYEFVPLKFDTPFVIPAETDLVVCYDVVFADSKSPMIFDGATAADGGGLFNIGAGWNSFSLVSSQLGNVVIGALVSLEDDAVAVVANNDFIAPESIIKVSGNMQEMNVEPFGVENNGVEVAPVSKAAAVKAATPKAVSFRVYHNGNMVKETAETSYSTTLEYGEHSIYVTSVFENGWESDPSEVLVYEIWPEHKEMAVAPYNLEGKADGSDLVLTWAKPADSQQLTKQHDGAAIAYGLTKSSGNVDAYAAVKYAAGELAEDEGKYITHIKYCLTDLENILAASVFVAYDENIMYEQEVDVETLIDVANGVNITSLDHAIKVESGKDLMVGYHLIYPTGSHPAVIDDTAEVEGGAVISSSGTQGYWYSLYSKSSKKINGNHRISAVLKKADSVLKLKDADATTYSVYRDGEAIANGIVETTYTVANALKGAYTVTAVANGIESAASNAVIIDQNLSGVEGVETMAIRYDAAAQRVVLATAADAVVYNAAGAMVVVADNASTIDMSALPAGVYVVKSSNATLRVVK